MPEEAPRISVSRDALRADLAEMELRLRVYFDDQLRHKADSSTVTELGLLLSAFARGEFNPAQQASIKVLAAAQTTADQDKGWTRRERIFGVIAIAVAVLSFLMTAAMSLTTAAGSSSPAPVTTTEAP